MKKAAPCIELFTTVMVCINGGGRSDGFRAEVVLARIAPGLKTPRLNKLLRSFEPDGADPIRKRSSVALAGVCATEDEVLKKLAECGVIEAE